MSYWFIFTGCETFLLNSKMTTDWLKSNKKKKIPIFSVSRSRIQLSETNYNQKFSYLSHVYDKALDHVMWAINLSSSFWIQIDPKCHKKVSFSLCNRILYQWLFIVGTWKEVDWSSLYGNELCNKLTGCKQRKRHIHDLPWGNINSRSTIWTETVSQTRSSIRYLPFSLCIKFAPRKI